MAELTKSEVQELVRQAVVGITARVDFNPFDVDYDAEILARYYDLKIQTLPGTVHGPAYAVEYGVFEDMTKPYSAYYAQWDKFGTRAETKRYAICYVVARMQWNKNHYILG